MGQTDSRVIGSELQQVTAPRLRASAQAYPETQKKIVLEVASDIEDLGEILSNLTLETTTVTLPGDQGGAQKAIEKHVAAKKVAEKGGNTVSAKAHDASGKAHTASKVAHESTAKVETTKVEGTKLHEEAKDKLKKAKEASDKGDTVAAKKLMKEGMDKQEESNKVFKKAIKLKKQAGVDHQVAQQAHEDASDAHKKAADQTTGALSVAHRKQSDAHDQFAKYHQDMATQKVGDIPAKGDDATGGTELAKIQDLTVLEKGKATKPNNNNGPVMVDMGATLTELQKNGAALM